MKESALALSLTGLSFMMTIIWGGPLLRILRHFKIGKQIRVEEPGKHFIKMGTPTMGGVMVILPVAMLTVLLNAASLLGVDVLGQSILVPLFARHVDELARLLPHRLHDLRMAVPEAVAAPARKQVEVSPPVGVRSS